jgi:hypothetical protein
MSRAPPSAARSAALAASTAIEPRSVSGAAARLAPASSQDARARDARGTWRAGIARKKHPEAVRGLLCLVTGGGLISVTLTAPLYTASARCGILVPQPELLMRGEPFPNTDQPS